MNVFLLTLLPFVMMAIGAAIVFVGIRAFIPNHGAVAEVAGRRTSSNLREDPEGAS